MIDEPEMIDGDEEPTSEMDDVTLLSIVEAEEDNVDDSTLQSERDTALDYYYGRATGKLAPPAVPNRSQYVSRDVADTVDWIVPALMKTFMGGDEVMEFTPRGPEDIEMADQETCYINHVITNQNPAYEVFSTWFDDALIQKNGYVFAYWKESQDVQEEQYQGIGQEELAMLMQDPEIELAGAEQDVDAYGMPVFNVVLKRVNKTGKVCIENIPPESVLVSWRHKSVRLQDSPFCGYDDYPSISELREQGFDVSDDISDDYSTDRESYNRTQYNDRDHDTAYTEDKSTRVVRCRHRWMRVDYDGDGIAELRYLMIVGRDILVNEKTDVVPIASLTPRIVAHNHTGRSIEDVVCDLQELNTQFMRGMIDNVVLSNNGRHAIDENLVNLDDMLVSRPGGVVRVNGSPGAAIFPLNHSMLGAPVMQAIEAVNGIKENRTGVTRYNMGTDAGSINKTATGAAIMASSGNQRIEWVARTFAETGVKELYQITHALTLKHSRKAEIVKLRNKWVQVDPRTWAKRNDMTISVGLGATNREMQTANLQRLGEVQKMAFQAGVVTPENIYNTASEMAKAMGFKNPDKFFTHPEKIPPKQPTPDPKMLKIEADNKNAEADRELEREKLGLEKESQQFDQAQVMGEQVWSLLGGMNIGGMNGAF